MSGTLGVGQLYGSRLVLANLLSKQLKYLRVESSQFLPLREIDQDICTVVVVMTKTKENEKIIIAKPVACRPHLSNLKSFPEHLVQLMLLMQARPNKKVLSFEIIFRTPAGQIASPQQTSYPLSEKELP